MNKTQLIDAMSADADISKAAAKKALESFLDNVGSSLKGGGRVSLVGFGSWSVSKRAAREMEEIQELVQLLRLLLKMLLNLKQELNYQVQLINKIIKVSKNLLREIFF